MIFKKYLVRKDLIDKLNEKTYSIKNSDEWNNTVINIIEKEILNSKFENDSDFLVIGRRKFIIDEFYNILSEDSKSLKYKGIENQLNFALGNLLEVIHGSNFISPNDVDKSKWIKNKDDSYTINEEYYNGLKNINYRYYKKGIICYEEKEIIMNMINALKSEINDKNKFKKNIDEEYEYYSKLYYEKFGIMAFIANPGGSKEQTIHAIKESLKANKDLLGDILNPSDNKNIY